MIGGMMCPLLAADVAAALAHLPARSGRRPWCDEIEPGSRRLPLEPEVRHDRRDDRAAPSARRGLQAERRDQRHQLVAVDQLALLVDDDQAVGVAVEREADVGAAGDDRLLQQLGMVEPQPSLMFVPFGATPSAMTSAPSSHSASGAT